MEFTWCEKFTRALEKVPDEQFVALARAILAYGTDGTEPELDFPLDALFESFKADIDYSHNRRNSGSRGGRSRSLKQSETATKQSETAFKLVETATKQSETACNPSQTDSQSDRQTTNKTDKHREGRMKRPTLQEVEAEIKARGYHVDASAFIAYYDSNGWKVGKNPMKSWKSALTTWERRSSGKEVQDADFSRFG